MLDKKIAVRIAIAAARNCLHVFEEEYPSDDRPRNAVEAAERWLADPVSADIGEIYKLETAVWRSKDWSGRASAAAEACGFAARAIRNPETSARASIIAECVANGIEFHRDYGRHCLWKFIRQSDRR